MQYKPSVWSKYTEHGKCTEKTAREAFISEQSEQHKNFDFSEVGLVIEANNPFLGASPD